MTTAVAHDITDYGLEPVLPEVFDASMVKTYMRCPSRFYYRYVLGRRKNGDSAALQWGKKWHQLLEAYDLTGRTDPEKAVQVLRDWPDVLHEMEDKGRTQNRMLKMFAAYVENYKAVDERNWETLRTEQFFDVQCDEDDDCPYGGCGLRWCGRIDRIARYKGERLYVWDYKTTSYLRRDFFDMQRHGVQMPGYAWLAAHITDEEPRGVWIDMLHVTKTQENLYRREVPMLRYDIRQWVEQTTRVVAEIRETFEKYPNEPWRWLKNWEACGDYGGCPYQDVDYAPPEFERDSRLKVLQHDYIVDRWNPANPDGDD